MGSEAGFISKCSLETGAAVGHKPVESLSHSRDIDQPELRNCMPETFEASAE
jgi:hypothetical protein